jgi:hypothetical protein
MKIRGNERGVGRTLAFLTITNLHILPLFLQQKRAMAMAK